MPRKEAAGTCDQDRAVVVAQPLLPFQTEAGETDTRVSDVPHRGPGGALDTAPVAPRTSLPAHDLPSLAPATPRGVSTPHPALVYIRHPRARRYVVRVKPDGTVRVTIPRRGTKRDAIAFAEEQRAWIDRQLQKAEQERQAPREEMSLAQQRAWRARAQRELPSRLLTLGRTLGLAVARVSIRNQRRRWGSCSRSGHICLNWRLVTMPDSVRDYVLIHELMHLKRMDHSPKFWTLVAAACPGFQEARAWLRANQSLLDSRA